MMKHLMNDELMNERRWTAVEGSQESRHNKAQGTTRHNCTRHNCTRHNKAQQGRPHKAAQGTGLLLTCCTRV